MPRLLNFIRLKIDHESDVEEIAQDTMLAFLENARDFVGKSRLSTYLMAIARHKIADFYRKKRLKKIVFSQLPEGWEAWITELIDPTVNLEKSLLAGKIAQVFTKLKPIYSRLLHLKYIEEKSVGEIAKTLTISFKSAEGMLYRARHAFIRVYEGKIRLSSIHQKSQTDP